MSERGATSRAVLTNPNAPISSFVPFHRADTPKQTNAVRCSRSGPLMSALMLSLALDPGRSGFRPTVIRVRTTKSAIARNDQRDALFQRPHAAIVPDVAPDVFYRAPGTLVGCARADVEQNGRCDRHYYEYELHGSSPIGQLALNVQSEAVLPISSEIKARRFTARYLPCFRQKG